MDARMNEVPRVGDGVLAAMVELLDDQARVARAEVALAGARKRLALSEERLVRLQSARARGAPAGAERAGETLRVRILEAMEGRPDEVLTPARIAELVGATNRDSVRNALLVLAGKGQIEKVGMGRYRARRGEA